MTKIEFIPNKETECEECGNTLEVIDVGFGPVCGPSFCPKCDMTKKERNLHYNKMAGFDDFVIRASVLELEKERGSNEN